MKKIVMLITALLLLMQGVPVVATENQTEATMAADSLKESNQSGHIKMDVAFEDAEGMLQPPTGWFAKTVFAYSANSGLSETMYLYNIQTLDVHSYVTAIGYLMEYIGLNKKDKNYYNVRFQGGEYAIAKDDIIRFFYPEDIKSFTHYENKNGVLTHYIEGNPLELNSWYYVSELGPAPSWMKEQTPYYSFSGIYFVEQTKRLGHKKMDKKAINKSNPLYAYYLYLPMRSKTSYTAKDLDRAFDFFYNKTSLSNKPTNMGGSGADFLQAEQTSGVNALLFMSIAMNESALGTSGYAIEDNNLFGYNAVDSYPDNADKFETINRGISEVANVVSWAYADADYQEGKNYYGAHLGNKGSGMNVKYASDPFWGEKAATNMFDIDRYLGNKDFQKYQLGIARQESQVYFDEKRKKPAHIYKKSTSSLKYMYPIILKNNQKVTEIALEPPYNSNGEIAERYPNGGTYLWKSGFIKKKEYLFVEAEIHNKL